MTKRTVSAALLGLVMLAAPLAASPDGKGLVSANVYGQVRPQSQKGYYYVGLQRLDMEYNRNSYMGFAANAVAPVGEWGSLTAAYSVDQGKSTLTGRDGLGSSLEINTFSSSDGFSVGTRLYPSYFVEGRFGNAEHGNPDGFLYWPVLSLTVQRATSKIWENVNSHTGGWAGATPRPQAEGMAWYSGYGIVLPLHRRFSLSASYSKQIYRQAEQNGNFAYDYGAFESLGARALIYVALRHRSPEDDPAGYFPGLGWPGDILLTPSFTQGYDLPSGRSTGRQLGLSVSGPINALLAVQAGYYVASYDSTYFANWPGFQVQSSQPDVHSMNLMLTLSLGELGLF